VKPPEDLMKTILFTSAICLVSMTAQAAETCQFRASEKKLAGAALTSFMTKCERDAGTTCDTTAKEKKLSGAAKTSFTKKCVADAVGSN
jgi:hypothetical protein